MSNAKFDSPAVSVSTTASNKKVSHTYCLPEQTGSCCWSQKNKDPAVVDTHHDTEEADDGVYCICKEPYDENRIMILCDG